MTQLRILVATTLALLIAPAVHGQQYPITQYQGFGHSQWSTSSPAVPDPGPTRGHHDSMSPDSWSAPATRSGELSEFQPTKSYKSTPSVPNLNDSNSFQPAAVYGSQPVPTPNSMRYPLRQNSGNAEDANLHSEQGTNSVEFGTQEISPHTNPGTANGFDSNQGWYGSDFNTMHSEISTTSPQPFRSEQSSGFESPLPEFRPDLGHRSEMPTYRQRMANDYGQQYGFEDKKKEYPPMSEILATGRYFGSATTLYSKGSFQGNTAIATSGGGLGEAIPFDFDYEAAPQFRLGFESKYGPGVELNYWQYDETSNVASFTSDGSVTGTTSTWMIGASQWSRLQATNAGERLDATHSVDIEGIGASFFKEIKFKISRLNGMFGFQYLSIAQSMDATLTSGGSEIGRLSSRSDMRAYGPRFGMEYYRPMGHTKLEFITAVGGSVLFGQRDQFVQNTATADLSRVGADEFITTIDFLSGVQYKKMVAENRSYFARLGMTYQTWIGGGTAVDPQGDFGLRGISFSVGYNR